MFDHVKFGVSDFEASKAFFAKALEPLDVVVVAEGEPGYGVELCGEGEASLCLFQTQEKPAHLILRPRFREGDGFEVNKIILKSSARARERRRGGVALFHM